jgi:ribosomal protein S18 acetylase RimI-like enzyme
MTEEEFIIKIIEKEDELLLKEMYLRDIEEDHDKASRFAHSLIYKQKTIACTHRNQVIGTISWDVRGGVEDGVIELTALGISPSFHRRGIGRELTLSLIREAKALFIKFGHKLRVIYLFMERNNEVGRKFYQSLGFREIFTIPSYLPHDDAVFWIKYF